MVRESGNPCTAARAAVSTFKDSNRRSVDSRTWRVLDSEWAEIREATYQCKRQSQDISAVQFECPGNAYRQYPVNCRGQVVQSGSRHTHTLNVRLSKHCLTYRSDRLMLVSRISLVGSLDRVSAMTLVFPGRCLILKLNADRAASQRCPVASSLVLVSKLIIELL